MQSDSALFSESNRKVDLKESIRRMEEELFAGRHQKAFMESGEAEKLKLNEERRNKHTNQNSLLTPVAENNKKLVSAFLNSRVSNLLKNLYHC